MQLQYSDIIMQIYILLRVAHNNNTVTTFACKPKRLYLTGYIVNTNRRKTLMNTLFSRNRRFLDLIARYSVYYKR
jgi:hypothetical protein